MLTRSAAANRSRVSIRVTKISGQGSGVVDHVKILFQYSLTTMQHLITCLLPFLIPSCVHAKCPNKMYATLVPAALVVVR